MLQAGVYTAKLSGPNETSQSGIVIYQTQAGALCAAIPCEIAEGEAQGEKIKHTMTIVKRDGTVNQGAMDTIKTVFGWDGIDPFWLMDRAFPDVTFKLNVEMEQDKNEDGTPRYYQDGNPAMFPKVKYLDPMSGGEMKMPQPADRRAIAAKFGAQFRALAGGTAVKHAAPASTKAPPAPPATKSPAPTTAPATMEEAWKTCCEANEGNEEGAWHQAMATLFPERTNSDLSPADWGLLKERFTKAK